MPVVTPTILKDGQAMDSAYELVSIDIRKEVNRVPQAELRLIDGSSAQRKFTISDDGFFDPGARIEIQLRYEGEPDTTVFKGVVVRHGVEAGPSGSILFVVIKDAVVKLTGLRQSALFADMSDSDIIKQLIADAGLSAGEIADTQPKHQKMVKYYATSWDFILSRAEAQGLLVVADDGVLSLAAIKLAGEAKHKFDYGITEILDLEIEVDAGSQYEEVASVGWDPKEQKPTDPTKASGTAVAPGDLDGAKLGQDAGQGKAVLSHPVPLTADELQSWADGRLARSRLALCRGRIAVPGFAAIKPLDVMELIGVSKHFNGKTLVTGFSHRIDRLGWRTDVQFGLAAAPFGTSDGIADAPAAGLLPPVSGLQVGIVASLDEDPDNELRVQVILPAVDPDKKTIWARLATPDAGKDRGYVFRPEPDDEVVVGFFNNDPRHPVILGSLYGSKNAPAQDLSPNDKNDRRGIVTKKGTTIGFVDGDKASVFIQTANKNKLLLDDDAEEVSLADQHGNKITMNKDGIVLKSAKDFKIDASGNVEIKGSKVDVK